MNQEDDPSNDVPTRILAGRTLLLANQPKDALDEFQSAYSGASAALASAALNTDSTALHDFVSAAYWRSAAFNQLSMWSQSEQQTYELVKLTNGEQMGLTAAESGLIHYARGRYYLESGALYDAIACFESALRWDDTLMRALRDRARAYSGIDRQVALYYAMLAVQVLPNSFDLRAEFSVALLNAHLWVLAEREASDLATGCPVQKSVALMLRARALAGQERIAEALDYCKRALEFDDQNHAALELMTALVGSETAHEAHVPTASQLEPPEMVVLAQENHGFVPEDDHIQRIETWLADASGFQDNQNYDRALELFGRVLEADPDNMAAICGQLSCLRLTHMFSAARAKAENSIERHPTDWRLHVEFGRVLHSQGEYIKALEWYDRASAEMPGNIEVGIARSVTLCARGNAGAAGDLINELLIKNPENFLLLEEKAWVALFQRNYGDADSSFRELYAKALDAFLSSGAPERAAEMAKTSYGRGYVAMKQGDHFAALNHFLEAKNLAPEIADYILAHAWSQAQTDDMRYLEEAKETCRKIIQITGSPLAHNCLGVIYFRLGFPNDSETHFKTAARSGPAYASHVDLGAVYASLAETERARREFRDAIKLDPHDADAHYELGALLLSTQDGASLRAAESEFRKARANDPNSVRAVLGLSRCRRLQGRMIEAEQELRRAIEQFTNARHDATRPDLWRLHAELAVLLIDRGNTTGDDRLYGKAYGEARTTIDLARTAWEPHYIAAVAAERSKHFRAAVSHLRNCLDCGGDRTNVENLRAELASRRTEARIQTAAPWLCGFIAVVMLVFVVLALSKIDRQSTAVLLALISVFVGMSLMVLFGNRLVKFSFAKIVTAELAAPAEQPLPVGPTGQFPAAGDRFDLPPRPFGQQPRRA